MPAPTAPLTGDDLLVAITDAMVVLHERYHHRAPVTAKTMVAGTTDRTTSLRGERPW